ncbi:MAG TPA: DegV family protein [Anaerolineaceae bacterium]|jgi:DegV family protein with EDD domain|nr:DegV family protein [Anaerolineales bacterium]HOG59051.1 DegV family protein [Anaerolineaceae bacterium]HOR84128.1 DegV family protein [Anaerolineaceae bacterium]HOT52495.1 DegV family protein [Anaerolineaceae bacterium]HPL42402.1 DegV family protein [Anaerolineaceae bacterium]
MKIVTDSGSDLTKEQCQELGVTMLPLKVQLGERTYLSGVDLSAEEFYELLDTTGQMPLTSTPSVGEFVDAYTKLAESDREILSIHISSGLSGTSNAARVAAKQVDADVTVVDTLTLSSGTGWQVEAAARAIKAGWGKEQILGLLKQIQAATNAYFTLPDLKYLIAGGRISHLKGLLASLLGIKPVIEVNQEDGKYYDISKKRSFLKAVQEIPELILKKHSEGTAFRAQIVTASNPEGGEMLREAVNKVFRCEWLPNCAIGPALGAHTGRGLVGLMHAPLAEYPQLP